MQPKEELGQKKYPECITERQKDGKREKETEDRKDRLIRVLGERKMGRGHV